MIWRLLIDGGGGGGGDFPSQEELLDIFLVRKNC